MERRTERYYICSRNRPDYILLGQSPVVCLFLILTQKGPKSLVFPPVAARVIFCMLQVSFIDRRGSARGCVCGLAMTVSCRLRAMFSEPL